MKLFILLFRLYYASYKHHEPTTNNHSTDIQPCEQLLAGWIVGAIFNDNNNNDGQQGPEMTTTH